MKNKIYLSTVVVAAIAIFSGCKKGDTGPAGTNGTNGSNATLTGSIAGFVTLYDKNSDFIENKSGVNITFEGNSMHATSDSTGRFEIDNVPAGIYNIDFNKAGFAETKTIGYQFVGGTNPTLITKVLNEPSSTVVQLDSLKYDTLNSAFMAYAELTYDDSLAKGSEIVIQYFIGLSNTVSASSYDVSFGTAYAVGNTNPVKITAYLNSLFTDYPIGTKVYIIAYGAPLNFNGYISPATGKSIYPGLNPTPSQVLSIVLP